MATIILLCAYSLILCLVILLTEHCLRHWKPTASRVGTAGECNRRGQGCFSPRRTAIGYKSFALGAFHLLKQ